MTPFRQEIRFAHTTDNLRIAYAVCGVGYPLVRAATLMSNVEQDWRIAVLGALFREFSTRYTLYRYNPRGYGLSEGDGCELSVETFVADLEAVVSAAKLQRFALWGSAAAGSLTAIAYAARHPERVSHLVLSAPISRGRMRAELPAEEVERHLAFVKLVELGWGDDNPAFRQVLTTLMFPRATREQITEINELLRVSASPRHAARMVMAIAQADVSALLGNVACPALVLHCRGASLMPTGEARKVASGIPHARFVPLDTDNYIPLPGELAFAQLIDEVEAFLPKLRDAAAGEAGLAALTRREQQVLDLLARGLDNANIAARLKISEKTVRNTVSHIFDKLAVNSRPQAIVMARDAGLGH